MKITAPFNEISSNSGIAPNMESGVNAGAHETKKNTFVEVST
jgi:hypothetical protein